MCLRLRQEFNLTIVPDEGFNLTIMPSEDLNTTIFPIDEGRENRTEFMSGTLRLFRSDIYGNYLTDNMQRSLYMFENDKIGPNFTAEDFNITCYGDCELRWPPLTVDSTNIPLFVGEGLDGTLVGTRLRQDGRMQLTYNNIPLYYYYLDRNPGDTLGQGIFGDGGYWYLIDRFGKPITTITTR
jgi:predicted lipoprotein with Yx(FWY)xxD motif